MHETPEVQPAHDVSMRGIGAGFALIVGGIVLAGVAGWLAYDRLSAAQGPDKPARMRVQGPSLEAAPQVPRAAYEAEKARLLTGYGWVDRQAGIARIPVEQAMRVLAARAAPDARKEQP
jgi:hypothetical protein